MLKRCIPIVILVFLFAGNSFSQTEKIKSCELKGYIKDLQTVSFIDNADSLITSNLIHNRINFKWNFSKHLFTRVEMRNQVFYGEQVKMIPGFGKYVSVDYGYFDLTKLWVDKKSLVAVSTFDRALLNYSSEVISVTAGRQRINWGINTVWNPNDLFNAYNFLDFDYEERPGSDAIRVQYFPSSFSSGELTYKPSKEKDRSVAAALFKFNKWKYDFQLLGGVYYNDIAIGTGWAGNINEAGFKGELTYFRNKDNIKAGNDDFTASITFDYSLKNNWYVSASALYVQNPFPVLFWKISTTSENLSAKSLMPYRWSFYTGVMKSFTPLFTGNLTVIYSPEDNSTILYPTLTYSIAENFDLDVTAQSFFQTNRENSKLQEIQSI